MINSEIKRRFWPVIEEFRREIAHHRAEGASERLIKRLLGASVWLAFQEVEDPEIRAWLTDEFTKATRVSPIVPNYPLDRTVH